MKSAFKWSMLLILIVIVVSAFMIFFKVFGGGGKAAIPPLGGSTVSEAVTQVERMNLEARVEEVESSLPEGTVLTQWPEAGTRIKEDQIVILKVSKGGRRITLPDVRGLEKAQAAEKLREAGFEIGDTVSIENKQVSAGIVIAQSPSAPAMVSHKKPIDLLVSDGGGREDGKITVPDLLQRQEDVARRMISESGLKLAGVKYEYTQNTPSGMVMRMSPSPGDALSPDSGVDIVVATMERSEGTEVADNENNVTVTMPGMAGRDPDEGQKTASSKDEEDQKTDVSLPGVTASEQKQDGEKKEKTVETPQQQESRKIAKIRYQVPPLSQSLSLKIELIDKEGTRVVLDREARGGEYISLDEGYSEEAVVTIYLGGDFVWQDKYQ